MSSARGENTHDGPRIFIVNKGNRVRLTRAARTTRTGPTLDRGHTVSRVAARSNRPCHTRPDRPHCAEQYDAAEARSTYTDASCFRRRRWCQAQQNGPAAKHGSRHSSLGPLNLGLGWTFGHWLPSGACCSRCASCQRYNYARWRIRWWNGADTTRSGPLDPVSPAAHRTAWLRSIQSGACESGGAALLRPGIRGDAIADTEQHVDDIRRFCYFSTHI